LTRLAEANGFLLDALDANRAGRYTHAQVAAIELSGRQELRRKLRGAWGALGAGLIALLFFMFAAGFNQRPMPGITSGPDPWVATGAKWLSIILCGAALLVFRAAFRSWRKLRTELRNGRIATQEGPVVSRSEFPYSDNPSAGTHYLYEIGGTAFYVNRKAHLEFQNLGPTCDFRAYYVPSRMWLVNMEPIPNATGGLLDTSVVIDHDVIDPRYFPTSRRYPP
jgi:hypothetical protein